MPLFKHGNLWDYPVDAIFISTNAFVRVDGALVMGKGAAREMTRLYKGIEYECGKLVEERKGEVGMLYGCVTLPKLYPATWAHQPLALVNLNYRSMPIREGIVNADVTLGLFQVKYDWSKPAELDLIEHSVAGLRNWCVMNPNKTVSLNFPGIGNGRRTREEVMPLLKELGTQVVVWEK